MANSIILTGNLVKDIEVRYMPESQKAVINNTLAVKRPYAKDKTDFIPIAIFGKTAENCEMFLRKGSKILVQGTLVVEQYEKEGEKKSFTKVNCDTVEFLDNKKTDGVPDGFEVVDPDSEDIPF